MLGGMLIVGRLDAVSALAMHCQPYGFSWEDVDGIRSIARNYECEHDASREFAHYEAMNWANSLADRIAALLPPREPKT